MNIVEAIKMIPDKLNNISTGTLKLYGDYNIMGAFIMRTPIDAIFDSVVNVISMGQFQKLKNKHGLQTLYHVGLVVGMNSDKGPVNVLVEKNEAILIKVFDSNTDIKKNTESLRINIKAGLNLNDMMANTLKFMGSAKFYDYNAIGREGVPRSNCQDFIKAILESNGIYTQAADKFMYQVLTPMENELSPHVSSVVQGITRLGSRIGRLIGKGRIGGKMKKQLDDEFIKFVVLNGFRWL